MVTRDLHIRKRLKDLLPSLTDDERQQLKANIEADGRVTDPILYWWDGKENVVVDGMHRFDIARRGNLPYQTQPIEIGDTYDDVELWILNRQLGRRNLLAPHAIRKVRGDLYNRLKRKDGGHGDQRSDRQNVGPKPNSARQVAQNAGVSPRTVERDGARAAALDKCSTSVQKGIETGAFKASDAEVKTLAKLPIEDQNTIATDLRKGHANSVRESMKTREIKAPKKPAKKKPPRKFDRPALFKRWEKAIGPVVRTVDDIAKQVGEKGCVSHKTILGQLEACTEEMAEWMGVEK